jgi:hypothetical protein
MKGLAMFGLMLLALAPAAARAQAPSPPPGTPSAPPAPGAPAAPPPAPAPGMRVATGQAAVVGGNSAAARERALDDAIKRAVDAAIADLADPATRAADAKAVKAILARARSFVPRYRALEESEANGFYTVRLEAEVDETALRAKLDRPTAPAPASTRTGAQQVAVIVGDGTPASAALAGALATALGAAGLRARTADAAAGGEIPTRVTAEIVDEGPLRGMSRASALCRGVARTGAPPAVPAAELAASERVFLTAGPGARPEAERAECAAKLAAALAGRLAAAIGAGGGAPVTGGDLRAVTVEAEIAEPAAVPALLRGLRSVGAVSAVELTRIAGGRADLRVRTRAPAATLASALSRDAGSVITLSDVEVSGDVIRLRARMRAVPAAAGGPAQ